MDEHISTRYTALRMTTTYQSVHTILHYEYCHKFYSQVSKHSTNQTQIFPFLHFLYHTHLKNTKHQLYRHSNRECLTSALRKRRKLHCLYLNLTLYLRNILWWRRILLYIFKPSSDYFQELKAKRIKIDTWRLIDKILSLSIKS